MKFSVQSKLTSCDALCVYLPQSKWSPKLFGALLPSSLEKEIKQRIKNKDFAGKKGEVLQIFTTFKNAKKIFLIGTGKPSVPSDTRKAGGVAIRTIKKAKAKKSTFLFSSDTDAKRLVSGAVLGSYEFKIGDQKDFFDPSEIVCVSPQKLIFSDIQSEATLAEATNFTRELVNFPPNYMTPEIFAQKAQEVAKGIRNPVKVKIYGEKEIKKLKMGSMFGVGQGSHEESKLIVLEYQGGKKSEKPIALLGKGVCFDSGGYNLKPTGHIEEMKSDMAGAALVLGVFRWLSQTKMKKNVIGIIGAVENLVSGNAFKPGDILTAMNGKTIEITNTDAEGRLVLADCLYYTATKHKPACMIDAATLTGAAIAALGYEITSIMGNNAKLLKSIKKSSEISDEMVWEMPITDLFREKTKGGISDLVNWTAGVSAGSSMGGAFLENFVEKTPWVHLDLGGTAFHGKYSDEITPKGATGAMVRTMAEFLKSF
jgi:leucyl aminopeptidase